MKGLIKRILRSYGICIERYPRALARVPSKMISVDLDFVLRDFIIGRGRPDDVTFMQIGAFDGRSGPLGKYIQKYGWKGVLLEPQEKYFHKLKDTYRDNSKVQLVRAAISHDNGVKTLYSVSDPEAEDMPEWAGQISSFDRDTLLSHGDAIPNLENRISATEVPTYNLMDLIHEQRFFNIDILQMDVEGFDAEVVNMVDFEMVRPSVINFENKHLNSHEYNSALRYLISNDYEVSKAGPDTVAYDRP